MHEGDIFFVFAAASAGADVPVVAMFWVVLVGLPEEVRKIGMGIAPSQGTSSAAAARLELAEASWVAAEVLVVAVSLSDHDSV